MPFSTRSAPGLVLLITTATIAHPLSAQQPNQVCQAVLQQTVFNTGETRSAESFASAFRSEFCDEEWQSREDIENRGKSFNLGFEDLTRTLNLGASDLSNAANRSTKYKEFCSKTVQDIAYGATFFNRYRDSDVAVKAWSECIKATTTEGIFALVSPDNGLTGASVTLAVKRSGEVPPLDIISVQPAGDYTVICNAGTTRAEDASFAAGKREAVISCIKAANRDATFTIDTNWGTYPPIRIPGFDSTMTALQSELAQLRQTINHRDVTINQLTETVTALKQQTDGMIFVPGYADAKKAELRPYDFPGASPTPPALTSYCGEGQVAVGIEITGSLDATGYILNPKEVKIRCSTLVQK